MDGISFIRDKDNKKIAVQIDLTLLETYGERLDDLYDLIVVECRAEEESISFEEVVETLTEKGKL